MADLTALADADHYWGQDVSLAPTGDIGRALRATRSKQRVLRRLMTNPGDNLFHADYGAGLPQKVGQLLDIPAIRALIRAQMRLEASVARSPEPAISVAAIPNGVAVAISYVALPDRQPVPLSFSLSI